MVRPAGEAGKGASIAEYLACRRDDLPAVALVIMVLLHKLLEAATAATRPSTRTPRGSVNGGDDRRHRAAPFGTGRNRHLYLIGGAIGHGSEHLALARREQNPTHAVVAQRLLRCG